MSRLMALADVCEPAQAGRKGDRGHAWWGQPAAASEKHMLLESVLVTSDF